MSCLICETSLPSRLSSLSCSCLFCHDCLSSWFLAALSSGSLHQIKCPNHTCHKVYTPFLFLDFLPRSHKTHLEPLLLTKILSLDEDYLPCPNPSCLQIGFKPKNHPCLEPYRCALCDSEFQRRVSGSYLEAFLSFLNDWLEQASSGVYRDLFTRECPGCGIPIAKNGGCDHMRCRRCDCEFCWKCLGKWGGHRRGMCGMREVVLWNIVGLIIVIGGIKVGMREEWEIGEVYGGLNCFVFIAMNLAVAYHNFSLFLLFYMPVLAILYSIFY